MLLLKNNRGNENESSQHFKKKNPSHHGMNHEKSFSISIIFQVILT